QDAVNNKGRKFYYHQSHVAEIEDIRRGRENAGNAKVEPLPRNARFTFEVSYQHLSDVELGLLIYALRLPEGLFHKLGMGKPLGMGTVRIDITGMRELPDDPRNRYQEFELSWSNIDLADLSGEAYQETNQRLQDRMDVFRKAFTGEYAKTLNQLVPDGLWNLSADNLDDLKIILSLVPYSRSIRYPTNNWFRSIRNSHKLPSIQDIHRDRNTKACWLPDP
ncbi:MAG: hypothetical protein ACE5Q6_08995, partial [Dehalococcoidia bacterium]